MLVCLVVIVEMNNLKAVTLLGIATRKPAGAANIRGLVHAILSLATTAFSRQGTATYCVEDGVCDGSELQYLLKHAITIEHTFLPRCQIRFARKCDWAFRHTVGVPVLISLAN